MFVSLAKVLFCLLSPLSIRSGNIMIWELFTNNDRKQTQVLQTFNLSTYWTNTSDLRLQVEPRHMAKGLWGVLWRHRTLSITKRCDRRRWVDGWYQAVRSSELSYYFLSQHQDARWQLQPSPSHRETIELWWRTPPHHHLLIVRIVNWTPETPPPTSTYSCLQPF